MPSKTVKKAKKTKGQQDDSVLPFEAHVRLAAQTIRAALAEASAAVQADPTRPQGLARQLNLDKSLAWHLSKIVTEPDVLDVVGHVPGRSGNRIVVKAFEKAGAADQALQALDAAFAAFDHMVAVHCGDRETLQMMLSDSANGDGQSRYEVHRKKLLQGASAIWGVKAKANMVAHFVAPADEEMFDLGTICGLVDFRRLRSDVPWAVGSVTQFTGDGVPKPPNVWEPADAGLGQSDAPLMREFCSKPLPKVRAVPGLAGSTRYELVEGAVGNTAASTCVIGWINRRCVPRYRTEADRFGEFLSHVTTPADTFVFDLYIHRDAGLLGGEEGSDAPALNLYGLLPGAPPYPMGGRDRGRLPLPEPMIDLGGARSVGGGAPDIILPEFAQYAQAVETLFTRLGWSSADFHGYRLKMRYPPIPTLAVFRHVLPERAVRSSKR